MIRRLLTPLWPRPRQDDADPTADPEDPWLPDAESVTGAGDDDDWPRLDTAPVMAEPPLPTVASRPDSPSAPRVPEPHRRPYADPAARNPAPTRYPPFLAGIPAEPVAALLEAQRELIVELRHAAGLPEDMYNAMLLPVVSRYAAYVHNLPASETQHHRGAGGLFRHGLEVAYYAARASHAIAFAMDRDPSERYHEVPLWRAAALLAGLLHDIGKPATDVAVTDYEGRLEWAPARMPLADWLRESRIEAYYLRWNDKRRHNAHESYGPLMLRHCVPADTQDWLSAADPRIFQSVVAATGGQDKQGLIGQLVMQAEAISVQADLKASGYDPTAFTLGVPVDRYIIDAMRELVHSGAWSANTPGSRLWMLADGLHVVWPEGGDDIRDLLRAQETPGVPRTAETMAEYLRDYGHLQSHAEDGGTGLYRWISPAPLTKGNGEPTRLRTLHLSSPDLLYHHEPPTPVQTWEEAKAAAQAGAQAGARAGARAGAGPRAQGQDRGQNRGQGQQAGGAAATASHPDAGQGRPRPPSGRIVSQASRPSLATDSTAPHGVSPPDTGSAHDRGHSDQPAHLTPSPAAPAAAQDTAAVGVQDLPPVPNLPDGHVVDPETGEILVECVQDDTASQPLVEADTGPPGPEADPRPKPEAEPEAEPELGPDHATPVLSSADDSAPLQFDGTGPDVPSGTAHGPAAAEPAPSTPSRAPSAPSRPHPTQTTGANPPGASRRPQHAQRADPAPSASPSATDAERKPKDKPKDGPRSNPQGKPQGKPDAKPSGGRRRQGRASAPDPAAQSSARDWLGKHDRAGGLLVRLAEAQRQGRRGHEPSWAPSPGSHGYQRNLVERGDAPVARAASPLWTVAFLALLLTGGLGALAALLLPELRGPATPVEPEETRSHLRFHAGELELPAFPRPSPPEPAPLPVPAEPVIEEPALALPELPPPEPRVGYMPPPPTPEEIARERRLSAPL